MVLLKQKKILSAKGGIAPEKTYTCQVSKNPGWRFRRKKSGIELTQFVVVEGGGSRYYLEDCQHALQRDAKRYWIGFEYTTQQSQNSDSYKEKEP